MEERRRELGGGGEESLNVVLLDLLGCNRVASFVHNLHPTCTHLALVGGERWASLLYISLVK